MRTEDVLAAIATGLWRWDNAGGTVTLDAEAARLLGLPDDPAAPAPGGSAGPGISAAPADPAVCGMSGARVSYPESAVRARIHPVDWNEINGVVSLSVAEGTVAEGRLRVVDTAGRVLRTVRTRTKPTSVDGGGFEMTGIIQEVAEPAEGTAAQTPVTGDWRRSREAFLLDAGRALAEARSTAEVLRVAASLSMPGFSPDGLAVFGTAAGDRLTIIGQHGHQSAGGDPFSDMRADADHPAAEVVRTGRAIYLPSPGDYARRYPTSWPLAQRLGRRSWAYLPLIVSGRTMGAWLAAFRHQVVFTPDERSVLTTVARMLAQALARAGVAETERELSEGLQRTMMPVIGPAIPGMAVAARYVPTGGGLQIGGDWYDMIPLPSGRIALVIGDVQGHDVWAAGLMGQLRIALRAYASEGHRPDAVLSRASRFLHGVTDAYDGAEHSGLRFATCLYMEYDPANGCVEIARAGHPEPAVRMADGTVIIRPTEGGLPLGIDPDSDYPTTRLTLEPGETMMICTDGLLETGGHDLDTGWARLREVLERHPSTGSLEELADSLVSAVHGPVSHYTVGPLADRREDDVALVLLSREGEPGPVEEAARRTAMTIAQAEPERIAAARGTVRELLHDWTDPEQVDSAVLMVSEMVTNVLVHTDGNAYLVARVTTPNGTGPAARAGGAGPAGPDPSKSRRVLRVEVADTSDELPHKRRPGELASSGRGLVLMEMLADAWGVDPRGEGKCIWFELHEPPKND
ncbi:SpoIIE family protein phosphatase [Streptomyces sp. NPDC020875]|uniref:ATP-binding SpoIIE family protein phosphatase n=1 Tax=Streptomyces sp. NPDC020875 TaxID=3154898 RepID=UPI0033EE4EDA